MTEPAGASAMEAIDGAIAPPFRLVARSGIVRPERYRATLGSHDVRVGVDGAALGSYPSSGRDERIGDGFVGRVVEIGAAVSDLPVGRRVVGIVREGAAATELVLPAAEVFEADEELPIDIAALVLATGLTALAIDWTGSIGPGQTALVLDVNGSAPCLLAGMIRRRGGTAIGWRVEPTGVDQLYRAGFAHVFVGPEPPEPADVREVTGGALADFVFDSTQTTARSWALVESFLDESGSALRWQDAVAADWDPMRSRSLDMVGEAARHFASRKEDLMEGLKRTLTELAREWAAGEFVAPIRSFPAAEAQDAYDAMREPHGLGRVVIRM